MDYRGAVADGSRCDELIWLAQAASFGAAFCHQK